MSPAFHAKSWTFSQRRSLNKPKKTNTFRHACRCYRIAELQGNSFCGLQFFPSVFSFFPPTCKPEERSAKTWPPPLSFHQSEKRLPDGWPIGAPKMFGPIALDQPKPEIGEERGGGNCRGTAATCNTRVTWSTNAAEIATQTEIIITIISSFV